jgi:hypothetical protein
MGAKRRQMNSRSDRGHVDQLVLERYAVTAPVTFPELKAQQDREVERAAFKRQRSRGGIKMAVLEEAA